MDTVLRLFAVVLMIALVLLTLAIIALRATTAVTRRRHTDKAENLATGGIHDYT